MLFSLQTSDYTLYENIPGHPTRFELRKKRDSLMFQAETDEEKSCWTQDVWDLYFSHMLQLKGMNIYNVEYMYMYIYIYMYMCIYRGHNMCQSGCIWLHNGLRLCMQTCCYV